MKKLVNLSYILSLVIAVAFSACQSNETRKMVKAATPNDPVIINKTTTTRLDKVDEGTRSGMGSGFSWIKGDGVFITETPDLTADDPTSTVVTDVKVGGVSRSDGYVLKDTIKCGESFIDVKFALAGEPITSDLTTNDSIGSKTSAIYTGNDNQTLDLEYWYKFLAVQSTLATPHYEPIPEVTGVRYEYDPLINPDSRVVWVKTTVTHKVEGTLQGISSVRELEIGYVQTKDAAVTPEDPFEVRLHNFDLFRTYRKKTQHSICEGFMSFAVYNARTGELVEEISTDGFSSQLAKCGHFGAPTNGYIVREASVLGSAPTTVTETKLTDNEEAIAASYEKGNFKLTVTCTSQDYYVNFPVRGRDDSEGGIAAGGQNLFFTATCVYTNPETGWTKTWEFTHKTEVNVKGWENRTPAVDRTGETVNDVDGVRNLRYAGTYVIEFVNHLYLNGEEVVQEDGNDDYYFQTSKVNGSTSPFHVSEMAIDCWTSYLP